MSSGGNFKFSSLEIGSITLIPEFKYAILALLILSLPSYVVGSLVLFADDC